MPISAYKILCEKICRYQFMRFLATVLLSELNKTGGDRIIIITITAVSFYLFAFAVVHTADLRI